MPRVEQWLQEAEPDIVCLQETKLADDAVPTDVFEKLGYKIAHHGEGRWNGVAILSRVGIEDVTFGFAEGIEPDTDARLISAWCGTETDQPIRIHSVYVPNGREVGHDHFHYKLGWLERLRSHLEATVKPTDAVVVAGDWNIAPDDRDVWDPAAFEGLTHVTADERAALANVVDWGLIDTFRHRYEEGGLYSYYDYQAGRFHKRQGIRIDYILASESLAERSIMDLVDRNARKGTKPSDHAPVLVRYH